MTNAFRPQSVEDIENKIEKLRKSYTPEWKFDRENPDAGSVIAQVFARQTVENNMLMSQMPERYHMEFVNMLDATLRPAQPAASMVIFNYGQAGLMGTQVPKGTRLTADSDTTESGFVVFETERNLYVTDAQIRSVFATDAENGTISPIFGDIKTPDIITGDISYTLDDEDFTEELLPSEEEEAEELEPSYIVPPFTLFGEKSNVGVSVFTIYEQRLFDGIDEPIYIRLEGAEEVIDRIKKKDLVFKYYSRKGFRTFDKVKLLEDGKTFMLIKKDKQQKVTIGEKEYAVVILESRKIMTDSLEIEGISLSAGGESKIPEYVGDGMQELDTGKFNPFSEELAVFNECYIGHDPCFAKAGSRITLKFKTNYHENNLRISAEEEEAELAIIKRKPRKTPYDNPAQAKVDEVTLEYFNGIGWKKIKCDTEYTGMFESCEEGDYSLSFICPEDWSRSESGPYSGRCLRMRIVKSANCYMRPAIHTYPTIVGLKISYSYEGKFTNPARIERIGGTKKEDITAKLYDNEPFTILSGIDYYEDAVYIGLDRKMTEGPVSIYFQLSDINNQSGVKVRMEYSTANGFSEMRFTDLTENFTRSGTVMFMPPADMAEKTLEGNKLYWIRILRAKSQKDDKDAFLPRIARLCLNAVVVTNVQTSEERDYYIDDIVPNLRMPLGADNILDAEVWVNEIGYTRKEEMDRLLEENPEMVRAEYDFLGRISAFYVLWKEVDNFADAPDRRCYRIDRMTGNIMFSDGAKCDMPRVTDDVAFKAKIRSTDGEDGNLSEGEIVGIIGSAPYIDTVFNPIRSHGGTNLETIDHALLRCAGIMNSRYKLVSERDYERFCLEFSDSIDRARIVVGERIDGSFNPSDISVVLLMKDFADGAFSFHRISARLQREMLKNCEVTISQDNLHMVEPIFVDISVCVWALVMDMDDSFEVQNEVKTVLSEYLNPVKSADNDGWEIGSLPKESQILMRLGVLRSRTVIQRITMIGHYIDSFGEHEMDTREIEVTPFMVPRNGQHKVIITNK
ncbi:hypothetical protein [Butyrivibrio sp. FCS014]|uniref:hypothetical protein n=1 Tax=Butyrivibrio sp. FCS014 TaxID=1408304 RepID=UPI0004666F7D|nr:hypothetical protein [Butyrivibrio sp. FCS014]